MNVRLAVIALHFRVAVGVCGMQTIRESSASLSDLARRQSRGDYPQSCALNSTCLINNALWNTQLLSGENISGAGMPFAC